MRLLIMTPGAFLEMLERAAAGDDPQDLMMEALDEAVQNQVNLSIEEADPSDD